MPPLVAGLAEHTGQVHGVAGGVGRANQLLGVGALLALEAGANRIGRFDYARLGC
jgi:hypothetical protein